MKNLITMAKLIIPSALIITAIYGSEPSFRFDPHARCYTRGSIAQYMLNIDLEPLDTKDSKTASDSKDMDIPNFSLPASAYQKNNTIKTHFSIQRLIK